MTSRNDVEVTYVDSPRVAEVADTSTEINMQDLVDTLRDAEYSWQGNTFKKLLNASGKEDLGGGVKVGITVALQNVLLAFEGRTTAAETGTVTSNPGSLVAGRDQFVDTAADFVTAGVARGSLVINFTDQSVAEVISVDDLNTLTTKTLVGGIGDTYDVADVYKVWNIVQCKADGGNLVAVDEAQSTIPAILPTAFTQVVTTSSSSATLQEQTDIQFASYGGHIYVDPNSPASTTGTEFPTGTRRQPAKTAEQALTIANEVGIGEIHFGVGSFVLPTGPNFGTIRFEGESANLTTLDVPAAATADNCEYMNMTLSGTIDGQALVERCVVGAMNVFNGFLFECGVIGPITLGSGSQANILNCFSLVPGGGTPYIDMGGSGQSLVLRGWNGGIEFRNKTGNDAMSVDMLSGQIIVNDSCQTSTSDIYLRGTAKWANRAAYAGTNVVDELVDGSELVIMRKIMRNKSTTDPATGIMTVYDDDGVTVLVSGNIYEDVLMAQAYRGRGMERRERLE